MRTPHTRREFLELALTAVPAAGFLTLGPGLRAAGNPAARPDSKVAGVQLGLNVPYSFGDAAMSGDEILKRCVQLGLSAVELRTQPVEAFLGVSPSLLARRRGLSAEESAARRDQLRDWRASVDLDRVAEFRSAYEQAGVLIEIVKVDGLAQMTDAELDYVFPLAKALGGRAISTEIFHEADDFRRVGAFADKHRLMVGYHGHASTSPADWEAAFTHARFNGANVDLGHFVAGNNTSPIPFLQQHHERITHIHVKDRKMNNGPNTPFGEGDTPIVEALRLIRDNQWDIQATIEFEYPIPEGSDRMTEIARGINYCRNALA